MNKATLLSFSLSPSFIEVVSDQLAPGAGDFLSLEHEVVLMNFHSLHVNQLPIRIELQSNRSPQRFDIEEKRYCSKNSGKTGFAIFSMFMERLFFRGVIVKRGMCNSLVLLTEGTELFCQVPASVELLRRRSV